MQYYTMANIFLELNHINNTARNSKCVLKYDSNNILTSQDRVWIYKFNIQTSPYSFPLYIPNIVPDDENDNPVQGSLMLTNNSKQLYKMDWVISVTYNDGTVKSRYVYWDKPGFEKSAPSGNMYENEYFWLNNSSQLTTMINASFNAICGEDVVIFVKNESRWSLLVHSEADIKYIHFNDNMKKYFPFNFEGISNNIKIEKVDQFAIMEDIYWRINTPHSSNRLFPFYKIIFKAQNLDVPSIYVQNNVNASTLTSYNTSENVILSYDLIVSDISSVASSISYTSNERDRSLTLSSPVLSKFSIIPYFIARDGTEFQIVLKNNDSVSLSMMFYNHY